MNTPKNNNHFNQKKHHNISNFLKNFSQKASPIFNSLSDGLRYIFLILAMDNAVADISDSRSIASTVIEVTSSTQDILEKYTPETQKEQPLQSTNFNDIPTLKDLDIVNKEQFNFLTFATNLNADKSMINDSYQRIFYENIWLFPADVLKHKLNTLYIGNIDEHYSKTWEHIDGYSQGHDKIIKIHWEVGSIFLNKDEIIIDDGVVLRELIHIIFSNGVNKHWETKWMINLWIHSGTERTLKTVHENLNNIRSVLAPSWNTNLFRKNYEKSNIQKDMATIWKYMFTSESLKYLERKALENTILQKKLQLMKEFFYEISNWQMNDEYWEKIKTREIQNAADAQEYFAKIKQDSSMKIKQKQREKNLNYHLTARK